MSYLIDYVINALFETNDLLIMLKKFVKMYILKPVIFVILFCATLTYAHFESINNVDF